MKNGRITIIFLVLLCCSLVLTSCKDTAKEKAAAEKTAADSRVVLPHLRGGVDSAKWSEGKAMMGTIGTAIRFYVAEKGPDGRPPRTLGELGFGTGDLDVTYFGDSDFTFSVSSMNPLTYTIICKPGERPEAPTVPAKMTLNQDGKWTSD